MRPNIVYNKQKKRVITSIKLFYQSIQLVRIVGKFDPWDWHTILEKISPFCALTWSIVALHWVKKPIETTNEKFWEITISFIYTHLCELKQQIKQRKAMEKIQATEIWETYMLFGLLNNLLIFIFVIFRFNFEEKRNLIKDNKRITRLLDYYTNFV